MKKVAEALIKKSPLGSFYFYNHTEEGIRMAHMLRHKRIKGYPKVSLAVTEEIKPSRQDLLLTERLLRSYRKAVQDIKIEKKTSRSDMWNFLEKGPHSKFISLLKMRDINEVAYYLCNMSKMGITHGITQGKLDYEKVLSNPIYRKWLSLFNLDKLVSLAEALGVLPLEDPEQGQFGLSILTDVDELVKKIENRLKISIIPPNIEGGLYKLKTKKGGVHNRDLTSVYTAWRCTQILKAIKNPSICEIGPGIGKTAYYLYILGIKDITLIDLPHINVLQGYYLIKSLPSASIVLYGEKKVKKNNSISILPNSEFRKLQKKRFNLTLNQDSFPEIDKKTVSVYLRQIKFNTKDFFLSINQESRNTMMVDKLRQHVVSELVSEVKGFSQIYRMIYWLREGYIEELYQIKNYDR